MPSHRAKLQIIKQGLPSAEHRNNIKFIGGALHLFFDLMSSPFSIDQLR